MRSLIWLLLLVPVSALAGPEYPRSFYDLPSSNGYGAVVVDFEQARAHHWRDHLFATEEPQYDTDGNELWQGEQPQAVHTRDLLFDAYFGLRVQGDAFWLAEQDVDLDASGWGDVGGGTGGGTHLVGMVQHGPGWTATTWTWSPWGLERSAMAMVVEVENTGNIALSDLQADLLLNLHLGEGRPGPDQETGAQNETVVLGTGVEERGFAGVTYARPFSAPQALSSWHPGADWENPYDVVRASDGQFDSRTGDQGTHDDSVSYLRWDLPQILPGEQARAGVVVAHHPDPFAVATLEAELEAWQGGLDAEGVLAREREGWGQFQAGLTIPPALAGEDLALYRQSAAVLRMAQVRESEYWLREWLTQDGEVRRSGFGDLPGTVQHKAYGSVLASLPPGRWAYSWPRDAAYAVAGMAHAGMQQEAADALRFVLNAESDRYRTYQELDGVPVEPYAVSLCRHHGFGVEESDTLGGGDFNFEFDGAGLTLWALGEYVRATGDWTLVEEQWERIEGPTAGFLEALIDPQLGLIHKDSSIWEHHWFGKERYWAYTSITAARGLCEAATFAEHMGDDAAADRFRAAGQQVRAAVLQHLQGPDRAIAATLVERELGHGYYDGAALEVINFGLVDPAGPIAEATARRLWEELTHEGARGYARNDDDWDQHDLSPWGGDYDSSEWAMIDLRATAAEYHLGNLEWAGAVLDWMTGRSAANYLAIAETYDSLGNYTNNAPMVGFGPGAWILAIHLREGLRSVEPACGAYPLEPDPPEASGDDDDSTPPDDDDDATHGGGDEWWDDDDPTGADDPGDGCACATGGAGAGLVFLPLLFRRRR